MKKYNFLFFVILVIGVVGCQVKPPKIQKSLLRDYNPPSYEAENGFVVGSIGYTSLPEGFLEKNQVTLQFDVQPIPHVRDNLVFMGVTFPFSDKKLKAGVLVKNSEGERVVLAYDLPPGKYQIKDRVLHIGYGKNDHLFEDKKSPVIFEVQKGEVTYIGSHMFSVKMDKSQPSLGSQVIFEQDNKIEDMKIFASKRPDINFDKVSEIVSKK